MDLMEQRDQRGRGDILESKDPLDRQAKKGPGGGPAGRAFKVNKVLQGARVPRASRAHRVLREVRAPRAHMVLREVRAFRGHRVQ